MFRPEIGIRHAHVQEGPGSEEEEEAANSYRILARLVWRSEAEVRRLRALEIAPRDPEIFNALGLSCAQHRDWERTLTCADRLVELVPRLRGPVT